MAHEPRPSSQEATPDTNELAARRTGMAFQRTRLSADRTLMAVIRTSLSLITFGFTIFMGFQKLAAAGVIQDPSAARHFGIALTCLGITMLVLGIGYHVAFMLGLRRERQRMKRSGLIYASSKYPVSLTLIIAVLLLVLGLLVTASLAFNVGPFE